MYDQAQDGVLGKRKGPHFAMHGLPQLAAAADGLCIAHDSG